MKNFSRKACLFNPFLLLLSMFLIFLFSGCSVFDDDDAVTTVLNGSTAAKTSLVEVASAECPNGGVKVETGIDENGNGVLDAGEVDNTEYVCDGDDGTAGNAGLNALVKIRKERKGENCVAGGLRVMSGLDDNASGELERGELDDTSYVCSTWDFTEPVSLTDGDIRGGRGAYVEFFRGIPYAKPPVGALRWATPEDPDDWTGTLDAVQNAEMCTQWEGAYNWIGTGNIVGSEDCLYLDVYRPNNGVDSGMPVYFWIHGGSNNSGSAKLYDGTALAAEQNMVVVVIQYRLGPFGWFRHADLRTGDAVQDSGNFGTLDHIKALEWVQDNIAQFGGDPTNVTIAGESAGAHNVQNLLIVDAAAGLFHRAVSESGGMTIEGPDAGDTRTDDTITALNSLSAGFAACGETAACLRAESAANILNARLSGDGGSMSGHSAYADGTVLPDTFPDTLIATINTGPANYNSVPVILGANTSEMKNFMPLFGLENWGSVYDLFDTGFDPAHEWTFEEIFPTDFDVTLYETCGEYGSRNWRSTYVDEIAEALIDQAGQDVFAYLFNWGEQDVGPEHFDTIFGSAHAMEIPFFFGGDESLFAYSFTAANKKGRVALQDAMMAYLGQFAAGGDPNDGPADILEWTQWMSGDGGRIVFDANADSHEIAMTSDDLETTADVAAALAAAIAAWTPEQQAAYGWMPGLFIW